MKKKNPLISIVIAMYNEQRDIENCIQSLKAQTYKPLEIIVVDDGSTDHSLKRLKHIKGIKYVSQSHQGPGAARNRGAKRAKGNILVFVDADMTFDKRFVDKLSKPIRTGAVIGSFSADEFVTNNENTWARLWSLQRGWKEGRMHPDNYPDIQQVFRAIRKEDFLRVGGFNEKVGYTDDWTIARKLNTQAVKAEGAVCYHRNPDSLKEVFLHAKWMAKRPYKLGIIGRTVALIRASFLFSLLFSLVRSIQFKSVKYIIFRLTFDLAQFLGISSMYFGGSRAK